MNVKKLKIIRAYCRIQRFEEKAAISEYLKLSPKDQILLMVEMKEFIKNKRSVGSREGGVKATNQDSASLVSMDTTVDC